MQIDKIKEAIQEARRFIYRAGKAISRIEGKDYRYVSKEVAACRRASMDLTRSLAELRK